MADKKAEKDFFDKIKSFFKGLKAEARKVNWPSAETTFKQTLVVLVISAILCGFIRLVDVLAQYLIGTVSSIF